MSTKMASCTKASFTTTRRVEMALRSMQMVIFIWGTSLIIKNMAMANSIGLVSLHAIPRLTSMSSSMKANGGVDFQMAMEFIKKLVGICSLGFSRMA